MSVRPARPGGSAAGGSLPASLGTSAPSLCPRGQPVVVARTQLRVPDGLNPEALACALPGSGARVSW